MSRNLIDVLRRVLESPRRVKQAIVAVADVIFTSAALWLALALKYESLVPPVDDLPLLLAFACVSALPVFIKFGLYRAVVRYFGLQALLAVIAGVTASVVILAGFDRILGHHQLSFSTLSIYWSLATIIVGGARLLMRFLFQSLVGRQAEKVVIYGAGEAGAQLAAALMGREDCWPVAFIDDKKSTHRTVIRGIEVFAPEALPALIRNRGVRGVLMALPSASRRRKQEILAQLEPFGLHVRSLPDMSEILSGTASSDDIREVDVADLLGRDPVPPDPHLFEAGVRGKAVMVTGAGGSIGSELCRQIVKLSPATLVLYENSELALYQIEMELRAAITKAGDVTRLIPLLGNAHHRDRVLDVMTSYHIHTVYHAAAYKHVPIVEQNVVEGVHNNVISTWNTAEAALAAQVETFVLISTDKAVNPTNVMGATKRMAEIVLQGLHERSTKTRFCMVRFGNVLASSGSVVPLFSEQIRAGGPITVTHPEVVRYFMTIPEAAQLVIQAGSMALGGDVFVLDMGKPVRIADLARRMVNLMGMTVRDETNSEGDIEIKYTGLRPAEKLFEELLIGSNVSGTEHPMIMRAVEHALPWARVEELLNRLMASLRSFDCYGAIELLKEAVEEYHAAPEIHDLVSHQKRQIMMDQRKVTDLQSRRGLRPSA